MIWRFVLILSVWSGQWCFGQEPTNAYSHFVSPEFMVGTMGEPNHLFPETTVQTGFHFSFGKFQEFNKSEWASRLGFPSTGITLGHNNLGNTEFVGHSFSAIPFIEFKTFRIAKKPVRINTGLGITYFNKIYDAGSNPNNRAVSTHFTWGYKLFAYYNLWESMRINWRLGMGYLHSSNGHSRLPNQGYNSFLLSASAQLKYAPKKLVENNKIHPGNFSKSSYAYFSFRSGIGQNVLSEIYNDRKEVYGLNVSVGKVINNTFKIGGGLYYRFYEQYHDYIEDGGELVVEDYPIFQENPTLYASNIGFFGHAELLMGHVGAEFQMGVNIYKPAYKIDWRLNQGYSYTKQTPDGPETVVVLGELDWYYEFKRSISSRLGLRYYLFSNNSYRRYNIFTGIAINANLGQADFNDISLGIVYNFQYHKGF